MAMLYCLRSSFGPQKTKFESSPCTIKQNISDNENINLKMPCFLWQGNLHNRASKIKCLLARHDIHFPGTIKQNISDNENINLKMPSFLWQGNLPNRASKIKCLLARHDIHLPRASVKLHLWPNDFTRQWGNSNSTA